MRSKWKYKYVDPFLYYQFHKHNQFYYFDKDESNNTRIKQLLSLEVWSRRSTILPDFLNSVVDIYNGTKFVNVKLDSAFVNHKFGEFAYSKKLGPTIHVFGKKKKKNKKK